MAIACFYSVDCEGPIGKDSHKLICQGLSRLLTRANAHHQQARKCHTGRTLLQAFLVLLLAEQTFLPHVGRHILLAFFPQWFFYFHSGSWTVGNWAGKHISGNSDAHWGIQMSGLPQIKMEIIDGSIMGNWAPKLGSRLFASWNTPHLYLTYSKTNALQLTDMPFCEKPKEMLFLATYLPHPVASMHTAVEIFLGESVISEYYFRICLTNHNPSWVYCIVERKRTNWKSTSSA